MPLPLIRILCVGKTREPWLKEAQALYTQKASPYLRLEWVESESEEPLKKAAKAGAVALDPRGQELDSVRWSQWLYRSLESHQELSLLIGGPDGFSPALRALLPPERCLSLSQLTMTHQVVRVVLAEQLYRAALIQVGHPYHRA